MNIVSRKDAKAAKLIKYYTGKPCKHGHLTDRLVSNKKCTECNIQQKNAWRIANPDKLKLQQIRYKEVNGDSMALSTSRWARINKDKKNVSTANRRAAKLNATPKWLTEVMRSEIEYFYKESSEKIIPHHVDHIVPLQGVLVCGLHVPWNLQVIPAKDNLKKSNTYD